VKHARSPISLAADAGLDWKTLTSEERGLVSKLARAAARHFEQMQADYTAERMKPEEIACVAVKYDDIGVLALPAPARHHHVMWTRLFIDGKATRGDAIQGFLTTKGRFVDRKKALAIATAREQVIHKHGNQSELYSEDMWDTPPEARGYRIINDEDPEPSAPSA
jgi:hypothetical protein